MGQWFQRLRANAKYGAVSDAAIQGYLRAASQIESVWQQIDDKVDELVLQGLPPWEAYSQLGYALAFIRACRLNVVFVQELLRAETATNAASAGYLPRVTYEQALALCEHIEPTIEEAIKASTNPRYVLPASTLPLKLGPHIGSEYQDLPLSHLQGFMRAAQEMRDWSAGLLAKYELALHAQNLPLPQEVSTHLAQMKSELELGDFHLRTGTDMVGQLSQVGVAQPLHQKAEGFLWEAMESFYQLDQLLAMPDLRRHPASPAARASAPAQMPARGPEHTAIQPPQFKRLPELPEPVALDLLHQVIAEPAPVHRVPAQASPNILKQVATRPQQPAPGAVQPPAETAGLLEQGQPAPGTRLRSSGAVQPPAETAGLLEQGQSAPGTRPRSSGAAQPPAEAAGLLEQGQPAPRSNQPRPARSVPAEPVQPDLSGLLAQPFAADAGPAARPHKTSEKRPPQESAQQALDPLAEMYRKREQGES
ncbi:MAG TPA: hypothetical protein VGD98_13620 [Ktedonobacteraceae bacterium]